MIDDEVILEENDTYTLECIATAGIPVADLRWYYKIPGSSDFVRIDTESEQELLDIDDCSQKAIQKIDVIVNPETDGIIYRCKVESNLLDDEERNSFYDDVLLKLPSMFYVYSTILSRVNKTCINTCCMQYKMSGKIMLAYTLLLFT